MLTIYMKRNTESLTTDRNYTGGLMGGAHYFSALLRIPVRCGSILQPHVSPATSLFRKPSALTLIARRHQSPFGLCILWLKLEIKRPATFELHAKDFLPRVCSDSVPPADGRCCDCLLSR